MNLMDITIPGLELRWYSEVGSTNDVAADWAATGAPDLAIVAADVQTQGRGRGQRNWHSTAGKSLTFSIIVRPNAAERAHLAWFSPLAGLAIRKALAGRGIAALVKWPNDVLVERRKVAGILSEAGWLGEELTSVVVGIGVNLDLSAQLAEQKLLFPAASLADFGYRADRLDLLTGIVGAFRELRVLLGTPALREEWLHWLAFRGERVILHAPGGQAVEGILAGINADGEVLVEEVDGRVSAWGAGDLSLRVG